MPTKQKIPFVSARGENGLRRKPNFKKGGPPVRALRGRWNYGSKASEHACGAVLVRGEYSRIGIRPVAKNVRRGTGPPGWGMRGAKAHRPYPHGETRLSFR